MLNIINAGVTPDVNDQTGAKSGWELIAGNAIGTVNEWQDYLPYPGGEIVSYEGNTYEAKYYISAGIAPDVNDQEGTISGWKLIDGPAVGQTPVWQDYLAYSGGTTVEHNGQLWINKWYANIGEEPGGADVWVLTN